MRTKKYSTIFNSAIIWTISISASVYFIYLAAIWWFMSNNPIIINSNHSKELFLKQMEGLYDQHKYLRVTIKTGKQRSGLQNNSLHLYLGMLANELNDAGLDMKKTLKADVDIPWTIDSAKDFLWRPIQKALTKKTSTTKPSTKDYVYIYEVLSRHLVDKFGVNVPWPSKDNINNK